MNKKSFKPNNPILINILHQLKKANKDNGAPIWLYASKIIAKPKRRRLSINVSQINRHTKENDEVLVPGKVLGTGLIDHAVKIAALDFSEKARFKISNANGKCLLISDLIKLNPKGSNIKIIR